MCKNENKIFLPKCKECEGFLSFTINPLNFTLNAECELNKKHIYNNIFFKTFERFYLKEKEENICSKCFKNLENTEIIKCEICNCIYCCKCYITDVQINGHKEITYIKNKNNCNKHFSNFIGYCFNCKENICINCIKKDDSHINHKTEIFIEEIPSLKDVDNLNQNFQKKKVYNDNIIKKIDEWKAKILSKIEELKQNLRDEISLFQKIINNYNYTFGNYTINRSFKIINEYFEKFRNENLYKFSKANNFEKETEILFEIFKCLGKKKFPENRHFNLTLKESFNNINLIERTINDCYIEYSESKYLDICYYGKDEDEIYTVLGESKRMEFLEEIYSITNSTIENKILLCLLQKKNVKIVDYNILEEAFDINENEIIDNSITRINQFYKCIQINKNKFLTSDSDFIKLWLDHSDHFEKVNQIEINALTLDLLLVNEEYFISSQPNVKTLTLYNKDNLEQIKIIPDTDCLDSNHSLFKIKNKYILINCYKGIGLFLIKTKELIQYFECFDSNNIKISCDDKDNIYIISQKMNCTFFSRSCSIKMGIANIIENEIVFIKEYDEFEIKNENLNITCLHDNVVLLWNNDSFICKEK